MSPLTRLVLFLCVWFSAVLAQTTTFPTTTDGIGMTVAFSASTDDTGATVGVVTLSTVLPSNTKNLNTIGNIPMYSEPTVTPSQAGTAKPPFLQFPTIQPTILDASAYLAAATPSQSPNAAYALTVAGSASVILSLLVGGMMFGAGLALV